MKRVLCVVFLAVGMDCHAEELSLPRWSSPGAGGLQRLLDPTYAPRFVADEPDPREDPRHPRLRIELSGRAFAFVTKVKKGPDALVQGFSPHKDGHLPGQINLGYSLNVDVRVFSWSSVGAVFTSMHVDGPHRNLHYEGIRLNGRSFPGGARARTSITVRYAELSLRYVWTHSQKVHLWFGIGPAWVSYRIALRGKPLRATGRIEAMLGPAFTYELSGRISELLSIFLNSGFAFAPARMPSYVVNNRLGLRWHLGAGFELTTALTTQSGRLTDSVEAFGDPRAGHRWRRARWASTAIEVGLAFSH